MKLDNFSKILIATGQINYMAASLNSVNNQMKTIPDYDGVHKEGIKQKDKMIEKVAVKLADIMEEMGNLINAHDCICPIDERVSKAPFEICVLGMDETEEDYETETNSHE